MKYIGIYCIVNKINQKRYIGSAKNIFNRFGQHRRNLRSNKHVNRKLQNAWNKYGESSFDFLIVEECDECELLFLEQKYLDLIADWDDVYNLKKYTSGGDTISNHHNAKEIIDKCTKFIIKYNQNLPDEERIRRSSSMKGENNINYGGKINGNKEIGNMISKKLKIFYENNESYRKGKSNVDILGEEKAKITSEKLSKLASKRIGDKNSFYNKHHTDKFKETLSEFRKDKYFGNQNIKFMIDNIEYFSLGDASKKLGIHITTIRFRLKSKNKKFDNYNYIE